MKAIITSFILFSLTLTFKSHALDASQNGGWISIGTPTRIHQGTQGKFYLNGDNQGSCAGRVPSYFRVDMNNEFFQEFYSLLLYVSAQKKSLECTVSSGCGDNEVWVSYCRVNL